MSKKSATRISFSEYDAVHLYELALEHFCVSEKEGVCYICLRIKNRLEKMIGKKEVARVRRNVKLHPY
ncbi:MAG: hypothetical protein AAB497_00105 [Patescibacteria group bacterium]